MKSFSITCNADRMNKCLELSKTLCLNNTIIQSPNGHTDPEIQRRASQIIEKGLSCRGNFACMIGHLMAMSEFLKTEDELCFIFEDDVRFHKDFNSYVEKIERYMNEKPDVDVVSLGFVNIPFGTITVYDNIQIIENTYVSNPYGTQCYMIRRRHAKKLVDFFSVDDIYSVYQDRFVADYTIFATDDKLKCNRTSLKFPIVIEDLSEQSIIGNNNKPNLLNILNKDMFLFGPDILMTT